MLAGVPDLLTEPPAQSFLGLPVATNFGAIDADLAIFGMPQGMPYRFRGAFMDSSDAPDAIRRAARPPSDRWDFEFDGPLLGDAGFRAVDCGDVIVDANDLEATRARAITVTSSILDAGAVPVMLGGDDSVPIPFFRGFERHGPMTIVQIDAHIDWRNEVDGVPEGFSSTMRRASELPWVEGIVQIGMRGAGSAGAEEVAAARAYGARIVPAHRLHEEGIGAALAEVPRDRRYLVTIDLDAVDPSLAPAVNAPAPGGLTYGQVTGLIHALTTHGAVAGMDVVELVPRLDATGASAATAARLVCHLIGALARP
jgi:agmatinase